MAKKAVAASKPSAAPAKKLPAKSAAKAAAAPARAKAPAAPAPTAAKTAPKTETKTETKTGAKHAQPVPAKASPKAAAPAAPAPKKAAPVKKTAVPEPAVTLASVKGETKDGIKYTKDFDAKFLTAQRKLLIEARESLTGQAVRLEDEANSLIDDEMGDVQFDDESGEGDTMVVERERDLFLSARARQDIEEIDNALARLTDGSYGYSVVSFKPIPRERLEAIPWATELTEEKVGGIGRR